MKRIVFSTLVLFVFSAMAIAQSTVGSINGTVSGPDGLLPGATVTIKDNQTGREFTTTTNNSGGYKFEQLNFGVYTLRVTLSGFKTYVANEVKIDVNQQYTLNPKLELGDVTAEVTVQAGAELVNADNGQLSTTVSPKQILDLPLNGRNPLSLLNLQAGVNATSNSINGQRSTAVNYTRDGINVQDQFIRTGGFVQDRPTVDDTGEFTVTTQNSGAEVGNGGSTQVQLVTPRGGNEFHGALFAFNRNSAFAANEFGNNSTGRDANGNENAPRPFLNRNQFGGKLSGPLPMFGIGEGTPFFFKDKAFFFVSYERFILNQGDSRTLRTLLGSARDGTFNYTDLGGVARSVNVLTGAGLNLGTAANQAAFAAAQGPLAVDPTIQARLLALSPTTGNSTLQTNGLTQNQVVNIPDNTRRNTYTVRIDTEIDDKNLVYGVFRVVQNADDRPDINRGFVDPFAFITSRTRSGLVAWSTNIASNITNEVRASYTDNNPFFAQSPNFPTDFVIGGLPLGLSNPLPTFQNQGRIVRQYTIQDNASYSFGNHTLRFGGEYVAQRIRPETNFSQIPIFSIAGTGNINTPRLATALFPGGISGGDRNNADALRYLLGGIVGAGQQSAPFQGPALGAVLGSSDVDNFRYDTWGFYISDRWALRPNLTLNLGLRWDYLGPYENPEQVFLEPDTEGATTLADIRTNLLDPTGQYQLVGGNAGVPGRFYTPDYSHFGPTVSAAWSPNFENGFFAKLIGGEGTVIRGSFKIGAVNDGFTTSTRSALAGNQGLNFTVAALQNGSTSLNARFDNLPGFNTPVSTADTF